MHSPPLVRIRDLARTFREGAGLRPVLCGASAELARGELVALLGRSGSGKSTLLHLVAGLDRPERGSVEVAGVDVTHLAEPRLTAFRRTHVGLVFQFFQLIPTLTVLENALLPLELGGELTRASRARALALLERVGMADRAAQFPDRLSGGEQQRVALARALVCDPPLVLADEPTANLDEESAATVLELFGELARAGKTVLVATHSAETARSSHRVLTLREGLLVEAGEPERALVLP